jgi:hypothetical protein
MNKIILAIFVLLLSNIAVAEEAKFGWAMLALQHKDFPCKKLDPYINKAPHPYVSVLWDTFGDSNKCLKRFLKKSKNKPHTLQVYMSNEVCRRKGNCRSYEFLPKLSVGEYNKRLANGHKKTFKAVRKKATEIRKFCESTGNHNTNCLIAIGLESQFTKQATKALVNQVKLAGWADDKIIHNPVNVGPYHGLGGAYYYESHGLWADLREGQERSIVSLDGTRPDLCGSSGEFSGDRVTDKDMQKWRDHYKTRTSFAALWCGPMQGLTTSTVAAKPARQRSLWVRSESINRYSELMGLGKENKKSNEVKPSLDNDKPKNKGCHKTEKFSGLGITVLKESDHGGVVAVFDPKYKRKFKRVLIESPDGKKHRLKFANWANPYNGRDRQHWRDRSKSWASFEDNSVLKALYKKSLFSRKRWICWQTKKAGKRHD